MAVFMAAQVRGLSAVELFKSNATSQHETQTQQHGQDQHQLPQVQGITAGDREGGTPPPAAASQAGGAVSAETPPLRRSTPDTEPGLPGDLRKLLRQLDVLQNLYQGWLPKDLADMVERRARAQLSF